MIGRLASFMLVLLICIDQLLQCFFKGLWWVITKRGSCPDPDETISGVLGRGMAEGKRWPIIPAAIVDALFLIFTLGRERNHCAGVFIGETVCARK